MRDFHWLNEGVLEEKDGAITIMAPAETDFFNFGENENREMVPDQTVSNAPYYYTEVEGDFVLRVKVSVPFVTDYDASGVMLMVDGNNWGKLCYELTDFGTHAVCSVVTNVHSDDANCVSLEGDSVWLQAARVGNYYAFHYSKDGQAYEMVRFFRMDTGRTLKVGLVAQSPLGQGGPRYFEHLSIEPRSVESLRKGE